MMKTAIIEVTQSDIDAAASMRPRGKPGDPDYYTAETCPIAQALRRMFPSAQAVQAGYCSLIARLANGDLFEAVPSERVNEFQRRWDDGRPVSPARFRVRKG